MTSRVDWDQLKGRTNAISSILLCSHDNEQNLKTTHLELLFHFDTFNIMKKRGEKKKKTSCPAVQQQQRIHTRHAPLILRMARISLKTPTWAFNGLNWMWSEKSENLFCKHMLFMLCLSVCTPLLHCCRTDWPTIPRFLGDVSWYLIDVFFR